MGENYMYQRLACSRGEEAGEEEEEERDGRIRGNVREQMVKCELVHRLAVILFCLCNALCVCVAGMFYCM